MFLYQSLLDFVSFTPPSSTSEPRSDNHWSIDNGPRILVSIMAVRLLVHALRARRGKRGTHVMLHLSTGCIAGCGFLTSEVRSENLKARNCGCPLPPGVCSVLSHGNCVKQEWALLAQEAQHSLPPILSLPVSWQLAQVLSTSSLNVDLLVGTLLMKSAAAGGLPHQSAGGVQALEFINRHVAVFF